MQKDASPVLPGSMRLCMGSMVLRWKRSLMGPLVRKRVMGVTTNGGNQQRGNSAMQGFSVNDPESYDPRRLHVSNTWRELYTMQPSHGWATYIDNMSDPTDFRKNVLASRGMSSSETTIMA